MKNLKLLILLFTIYSLLFTKFIFANLPVNDFHYQYEKYTKDYQDFTAAKNKYLKYKTLTAKKQVAVATKRLISQRNQVLRTYFLALKQKLRTTSSVVSIDQQTALMSKLDKEISWLKEQNNQLQNIIKPNLEDLFIISDRTEAKENYFKLLAYQSLSAVFLGKVRDLYSQSVAITSLLTSQISGNKESKATQSAELKDWLREVENKNYLAQKELEIADNNLIKMSKKSRESQIIPIYQEIKKSLSKAKNYLFQASILQKEIYSMFALKEENGS